MTRVETTYDGPQHCSALKEPQGKTVTMDCPYTGKGEEFSPTNLVEAALAGCMLRRGIPRLPEQGTHAHSEKHQAGPVD